MKTRFRPTVVWLAWTALILPIETTFAQLELVVPADGEQFQPGNTITLRATVIDDTGEPWQLEFFDGEELIGQTLPDKPIWCIAPVENGLELIILTERGQTYSLESSGNPIDWIPTPDLETIVSLEESIQLVVPRLPGVRKQFYSIVSIVARDTGNPIDRSNWDYWKTVDELFDWIQEAIDGGGVNLERPESITYDQEFGYPTSGYIDYRLIADEERGFDLQLTSISLQPLNQDR